MKHGDALGIRRGVGGGAYKKELAFKTGEMAQKIDSEWAVTSR